MFGGACDDCAVVPDCDQLIDAELRGRFAHVAMAGLRFFAKLAHFAKNSNPFSIGIEFDERAQRRFHRIGIGVVAVVNELHAANFLDLQSRSGQRRGSQPSRAFFDRQSKGAPGRDGKQRVLHHVQTGHGQLCTAAVRTFKNCELTAIGGLSNIGCPNRSAFDTGKHNFSARARGYYFAERVVRVQNHRAFEADCFYERAFLVGNCVA